MRRKPPASAALARSVELHPAHLGHRMRHVEAPDEVVLVTDARGGLLVRREQQPGRLEPAGRDHERARLDLEAPLRAARHHGTLHRAAHGVAIQPCDRGVMDHPHVGRQVEPLPVAPPEVHRRAPAPQPPVLQEALAVADHERLGHRQGLGVLILERTEVAVLVGAGVVRVQRVRADRPAAPRNPVAVLEVDRLERRAATAPLGGRAPQTALAHQLERIVVGARLELPAARILALVLRPRATRLEEHHLEAGARELEGGGHAGRA